MKHLVKMLFVPLLAFFSCTSPVDEIWDGSNLSQDSGESSPETGLHPVGVRFSKSSIAAFAEEGISEIGIYVYMSDSLIYGEKQPLVHGAIEVPLPLGENLQTFVVANADEVTGADRLSTVTIRQKDNMQKPVYISEITGFTSDNSVKSLSVELKQLMGQAVFSPKETQEEMDAITRFDALDVTFTNVGVAYNVKDEKAVLGNVTVRTDRETGFSAFVYSFPTENNGSRTSVDVSYLKEGKVVNRTNGALDTGIAFKSAKRSVVHMEILNEDWVETKWENTIEETDF